MTSVTREGEGGTNRVLPVLPVPPLSSPSADVLPELASRLRQLAEARVREQVAAAAISRQTATDARTAQGERRHHGVRKRNAAREARIRLTEIHNKPEENQP